MFYLAFFYCHRFIGIWFFVSLLRCSVVRRFVVTFYLSKGDSDRKNGSDQSNISNYSRQYVEN